MKYSTYVTTLLEHLKHGSLTRKTIISGKGIGDEALFANGKLLAEYAKQGHAWERDDTILSENLGTLVHLVLCGGGHVAQQIYAMALQLGLQVSVLDEREEFCNPTLYPQAQLHCSEFATTLSQDNGWVRPYFVIVTRGHGFDQVCLQHILRLPHAYVGMIGSRAKVAKTFADLREKGFTESELQSVYAPIGLNIGASSAAEIAVSILAQIIGEYRRDTSVVRLDPSFLSKLAQLEHFILVRVLEKHGSTPCEVGFEMAVNSNGTTLGTVGGGMIEAKAIEFAQLMVRDATIPNQSIHYELDANKAGSIGMICGGNALLLFQRR